MLPFSANNPDDLFTSVRLVDKYITGTSLAELQYNLKNTC